MERAIRSAESRRDADDLGAMLAGSQADAAYGSGAGLGPALSGRARAYALADAQSGSGSPCEGAPLIARQPPDRHSLFCALAGAALYLALFMIGQSGFRLDGAVPTIGLPNAGAVALLLLFNPRNEIAFYAALLPASVFAGVWSGSAFATALSGSLAGLAGILTVTWLTRRHCGRTPDMTRFATFVRFVWIAGVIGPLVSASLATTGMLVSGGEPSGLASPLDPSRAGRVFLYAFLGESMGMILIIPTVLLLRAALASGQIPPRRTLAEGAALLAFSVVCTLLVFGQAAHSLLLLVLPVTLVLAFRLGVTGTMLHVALVAIVAIGMTFTGNGPLVAASAPRFVQMHLIQAFIAANFLTGMAISALRAGRARLADALIDGRRELALLTNSITDAVLKIDRDGVCTYASPAVRTVLGEDPARLIGRPFDALMQEDAGPRIADIMNRLLAGHSEKERLTYRRRLDDEDGVPVFIEADCAIASDPATGAREGVIVSARDVTERVELELLLTRARRHAENAASAKSDFLANMSHEIRTPMNGVLGFAELLLQGELDPEQRRRAEMIVASGRSMMLLLNDILDFSKIEAGQIVIDTGPVDLDATLEECIALHRPGARKRGIELRLECVPFGPYGEDAAPHGAVPGRTRLPEVITDGLRLRQIALNLIGNAIKFTESGEVRVSYWAANGELRVRVRDTGIGIQPGRMEQIFLPFTQGDSRISQRFGGTGLGLSISRQLAELLGGRITVESVPSEGSTFTLILPTELAEPREEGPKQTPTPTPKPPPSDSVVQEGRILLVEDNEVNRVLVTEMLERCGQRIAIAHDGNEAISMVMDSVVRARPFDLVLMDVQMPDCDGYEATRTIREEGIGADALPIIALTANAFPEDIAAARAAGMQGHLAKPIAFADLARTLQRWLPTRIVELPMDCDVPPPKPDGEVKTRQIGRNVSGDGPPATGQPGKGEKGGIEDRARSGTGDLYTRWMARRFDTIEAVRQGLADGLVGNAKKRRAQDAADRHALIRKLHKLAGTAGSFGEPELGDQAAALERAMADKASCEECEAMAFDLLALADEPPSALPVSAIARG